MSIEQLQPVEPDWDDDDPGWDELALHEQIEYERRTRAAAERRHQDDGLLIAGWACALLFQPVGVAIGIILLVRQRVDHGLAILFLSLIVMTSLALTASQALACQ